jgi:hypothetical protein
MMVQQNKTIVGAMLCSQFKNSSGWCDQKQGLEIMDPLE